MTQTSNRFLDEIGKLVTDAAGAAQSLGREVETVVKAQLEKLTADMDLAPREELETVKAMATRAREENEALKARIDALETRLAALEGAGGASVQEGTADGA